VGSEMCIRDRRFTIAYRLYSQEKRKWLLNSADAIARFENLVVNVKSTAGET